MLPPQRVLHPPPPGYVAEWQARVEVFIWRETTVYAVFPPAFQREIERAWVRGEACIFFVYESDQTWRIDLNSWTMQRVNCQPEWQHTSPVRRVFVPAEPAAEVRVPFENRGPGEWT